MLTKAGQQFLLEGGFYHNVGKPGVFFLGMSVLTRGRFFWWRKKYERQPVTVEFVKDERKFTSSKASWMFADISMSDPKLHLYFGDTLLGSCHLGCAPTMHSTLTADYSITLN